jgi:hypothetical protein
MQRVDSSPFDRCVNAVPIPKPRFYGKGGIRSGEANQGLSRHSFSFLLYTNKLEHAESLIPACRLSTCWLMLQPH